jgi:phage shock protein A
VDQEVARRTAALEAEKGQLQHQIVALKQANANMEAYVAECEAQDEQLDAQMDAQMEEAHKTTAFFRQLVRDCTRGDGVIGRQMGMYM